MFSLIERFLFQDSMFSGEFINLYTPFTSQPENPLG